jgi:hypothetical protein
MELKWLGTVAQFGWELNQTEYGREEVRRELLSKNECSVYTCMQLEHSA